jgi:hypothetical protein
MIEMKVIDRLPVTEPERILLVFAEYLDQFILVEGGEP